MQGRLLQRCFRLASLLNLRVREHTAVAEARGRPVDLAVLDCLGDALNPLRGSLFASQLAPMATMYTRGRLICNQVRLFNNTALTPEKNSRNWSQNSRKGESPRSSLSAKEPTCSKIAPKGLCSSKSSLNLQNVMPHSG